MVTSILFVHSPLVGPSTWATSAELMRSRGFTVVVPDLTAVAQAPPPRWQAFVDAAVAELDVPVGEVAVVGHSGAGVFLPAIAQRLGSDAVMLLFVDAVVPPSSGVHQTPASLQARLDDQTVDGRLRPWLEWWPDEVVRELVPHPDDRAALRDDMPSLPREFYDESVPVPEGWMARECAYLKLSDAYDDEFAEARRRGWRCVELGADHLAIRTRPQQVVAVIASLLEGAQPRRRGDCGPP